MTERLNGRIVTPDGVVAGAVIVADGRIDAIEPGPVETEQWILPGFVDLHVHGGDGYTFTTGDADAARRAAEFHRDHGTTTILAGLVSSPFDVMCTATTAYRPLCEEGVLGGIHLEGPFLASARCGAQNPAYLRDPALDEITELLARGAGAIRMVTVAPDRAGAMDAIRHLTAAGVTVAIGHTDATYRQTVAAIAAGASVATHLFNGMRPIHHRDPGPVVALLDAPTVACELIADGVHLDDATLRFAARVAGPDRSLLITDAIAAAGRPDGEYELGGQRVIVTDRVAHLARTGSVAGSTLTMDAALRHAVRAGISIVDAARMAATTPARVLGLAGVTGAITPGLRADIVVLDAGMRVVRVVRG